MYCDNTIFVVLKFQVLCLYKFKVIQSFRFDVDYDYP